MIGAALKSNYGAPICCEISAVFNISVFLILFIFNGDCRVVSEHHKFNKELEELRAQNPEYNKVEDTEEEQLPIKGQSFGGSVHNRRNQSVGYSMYGAHRTTS